MKPGRSTARIRCAPRGARCGSRWGLLILAVASSACITPGAAGTSATSTTSTTSTTSSTDGMSSTSASATSTTTMETSTSTTSTATSCSFLCMPDGGYPDPLECDFWKQDCREGQKCAPWASDGGGAWNSTKCVPVDPDPDGLHEPCTVEGSGVSGIDSCDKGAMCWNVDPRTNMGFCIALCQGDEAKCTEDPESCCPEWSTCYGSASGVHNLCFQTCDPWIQNCEYYKEGCYPHGVGFWCAPFQPGDGGVVGDPCSQDSECDPGTYCGDSTAYPKCNPNVPGCCTPFCSLMAPDCIDGAECLPWFDPMDPPWGYEDLGACAIP